MQTPSILHWLHLNVLFSMAFNHFLTLVHETKDSEYNMQPQILKQVLVKKSVHYTLVNTVVRKYDFRRRVNQVSVKYLPNVRGLMINMSTDLLSVYISADA